MPNPNYGLLRLGSFSFKHNPPVNRNQAIRAITTIPTMSSVVTTDWGMIEQDRLLQYSWPQMLPDDYWTIYALHVAGGIYSFTDEWGTARNVVIMSFVSDQTQTAGVLFTNVVLGLQVQ